MTRKAKLFILFHKDWKQLADRIENDNDYALKFDVTIFQLFSSSDNQQYYAIISLSEKADKIIEDYGATPAHEKDYLHITLHDYFGNPLYGDKNNVIYLEKFS